VARGEKWEFKKFVNQTQVNLDGRPLFLDRFDLSRRGFQLGALGGMETLTYSGMFGVFTASFSDWNELASSLQRELKSLTPVGVSLLARHGCIVRTLTNSAIQLLDATRKIWAIAREKVLHLQPCDLRKF
jgi:urease accessory protein UreH